MKRILTIVAVIIILIGGFVFAVLNANTTTFNYYLGHVQLPLSLLLVLAFILGGICGLLFSFKSLIQHKLVVHRLSQKLKKLTPKEEAHETEI
jgi:putative membrane protein